MKTAIGCTITRKVQQAAQQAVRNNVMDYDMRHGYRGPSNVLWKVGESSWDSKKITDTLKALPTYGPLLPAVVQGQSQEAVARWRTVLRVPAHGRRALGASLSLGYPARPNAA
jgi:membrane carboxypeptidase/penicillin-binding protein